VENGDGEWRPAEKMVSNANRFVSRSKGCVIVILIIGRVVMMLEGTVGSWECHSFSFPSPHYIIVIIIHSSPAVRMRWRSSLRSSVQGRGGGASFFDIVAVVGRAVLYSYHRPPPFLVGTGSMVESATTA